MVHRQHKSVAKLLAATSEGLRAKSESSSAGKENFLANLSPEIRTPHECHPWVYQFAKTKKPGSESLMYVQTIQRSGENLLTIVNDIFRFLQD